MRKIKVGEGEGVYKLFVQIPKDGDEVARVLRLIRDISPTMPLSAHDVVVTYRMEGSWIDTERAAVVAFYDVDPYALARRPESDEESNDQGTECDQATTGHAGLEEV